MITIDTTNMCSHLQKKLFEEDGIYHSLFKLEQPVLLVELFRHINFVFHLHQSNNFFHIHSTVTAPTTQNTKLVR